MGKKNHSFCEKSLDNRNPLRYNAIAVHKYAAIAQSVERILGKDEVASSNLASSSKTLKLLEFRGFFLLLHTKSDRILFR